MIRAEVKCKPTYKNNKDTFPMEFPVVPEKGQIVVSQENHFFEVEEVVWKTDNFQKAQLVVTVKPMESVLCG